MTQPVAYLNTDSGAQLAYYQLKGEQPGVVFCCGFMSDMTGAKAAFVENFCREQGRAFVRFDYRGHGQSSGDLTKINISSWLADTLAVLDHLTNGPQFIIGSSMGAWIATLVAKARPERIKKLIGIAAAPDFTEDLIWTQLPSEMQKRLLQDEVLYFPSEYSNKPYAITRQFIEDGRNNLILRTAIPVNCPVHLLHGMQDADIPWQISLKLAECIQSADVKLTLIKDGNHRLSREQDLVLLSQALANHCA